MRALVWFCLCVCATVYVVSRDAPGWMIAANIVFDAFALIGAARALSSDN
jgi:hypothetical protein